MNENDENVATALETEFQTLVDTIGKQIKEKIDAAEKLLEEATDLSDATGVPFYSSISALAQTYVPASFTNGKFSELDPEFVERITDVSEYDLDSGYGWAHSQVC